MEGCGKCRGRGLIEGTVSQPCRCVLRNIFRVCHRKFVECQSPELCSQPRLDRLGGSGTHFHYGLKQQEYSADFVLTARRVLCARPVEWQVFWWHFVRGLGWKRCASLIGLSRGAFFHLIYIVEERVGRVLRETRPYSLYPLDEYFASTAGRGACAAAGDAVPITKVRSRKVAVPLKRAA